MADPSGYSGGRPCERAETVKDQEGFTLLELVAVLALLTLMMGLVLPGLQRTLKREHERANLRQLVTTLRLARSVATTTHRRVRVFLDIKARQYRLEGSDQRGEFPGLTPAEARLVWQSSERLQGYIAFYGDGSSSGGTLTLEEPGGLRHVLDVEVITGKVTLRTARP
jgi:general secretion pathway protein H